MNKKKELNEKWIKASIIGTIWAASEIVLGSFLHNLKVPFSGNILTAIGIIILISVSYIWTEKGLFWRAGLICAIMKTMSPSAVIFGPMIAIFSQAVLLEISVRLFGRSLLGYSLGAMLAMSWNLFQKIVNYIIIYGFNIVEIYTDLIELAQKKLHIQLDMVWLPIIVLLIIYCLFGLISAIVGIKVGRKILKQPAKYKSVSISNKFLKKQNKINHKFNYSLIWLFANIILIISSLALLKYTSWIFWSLSIITIVTIWAFRYKRALRQLSRPRFWIFFVIITMIATFVFTKIQSYSLEKGLLIGFQMNFRAVIIIVGFSVLGTELYNPKIQNYFSKASFKQLPLALELSFESLPSMIANIPDFKSIIKNPISVIYQIISQAEYRLADMKPQIIFDYSGAELVLKYLSSNDLSDAIKVVKHPGYKHILTHSQKYSSDPITKENLKSSLHGKIEGFDFSHVKERKDEYIRIIKYLKENKQEIINEYVKLCLIYLPDDYQQKATIYYVIGGYNGIAFNDKICMNIDYEQFRNNYNEVKLYIAHELFHIGFEKYQSLPDIFKAKTVKDLKEIVLLMTMNEGLATLTPYKKRIEMNEISDYDYKILLDTTALNEKLNQFNSVIKYLDENIDKKLTNEILGNILGQCSGDRLFYIVGCYIGLRIEEKYGSDKIQKLIKENPEKYFETYYQLSL